MCLKGTLCTHTGENGTARICLDKKTLICHKRRVSFSLSRRKGAHLYFTVLSPLNRTQRTASSHEPHPCPWTGPSQHADSPGAPKLGVWKPEWHHVLEKRLSWVLIIEHKSSPDVGVLFPEIVYNGFRKVGVFFLKEF